jgi:ABC-type lipoprotein release transport system permease subunit
MSWDTIRSNKLRSSLTVLGIVIGITSIVGITSLLRGFEESFKDLIRQIGPDTIFRPEVFRYHGEWRQLRGHHAPAEHHAGRCGRDRQVAVHRDD